MRNCPARKILCILPLKIRRHVRDRQEAVEGKLLSYVLKR